MNKLAKRSILESMELVGENLKQSLLGFIEFGQVAFYYYSNFSFMKTDLSLMLMYFFDGPYAISKKFLQDREEENVYAYGETPLASMEQIAKACNISEKDHVYDLGCGRGRSCFWLESFCGCRVTGIDFIGKFIERANRIKTKLGLDKLAFVKANYLNIDFEDASVIYLYGTMLEEDQIKTLIEKFEQMPSGTKIVTVSYPLKDYTDSGCFEVMKYFTVPFPWGSGDVYVQIKK